MAFKRIVWVVLDSVGIGALPDADEYGDTGRSTLGHVAESRALAIPNLVWLGLANIEPLAHLTPAKAPMACFGKGATRSPGKDTTTGHWEMAGIWLPQAFPVYPQGFPPEVMEAFERAIGRRTLGNKPASGTEILKELGAEHMRTGYPIVYTSGDSVFQIAAHEEVIPVAELYRYCQIARKILDGPHRVGRVIARPFTGAPGNFRRTERRHDYAVEPPKPMLLDVLAERGVNVLGIGKIHDIYNGRGVGNYVTTKSNADGMEKLARGDGTAARWADLREPGGFRHALRASQGRGGLRAIAGRVRYAAGAAAGEVGADRSAPDYGGPRVRSRSSLAYDGSLAGVRADIGAQPGRAAGQEFRRARDAG